MGWFIAVHTGAGRYGTTNEERYLELIRQALEHGRHLLANTSTNEKQQSSDARGATLATEVATQMLSVFERSDLCNAGRGSNLTEHRRVECEATVVCGKRQLVTACANVSGVAEPSALTYALLKQAGMASSVSHNENDEAIGNANYPEFSFGRQVPLVVVGEHTRILAQQFGLKTATSPADLEQFQATEDAKQHWTNWHQRFQQVRSAKGTTTTRASESPSAEQHDTAINGHGNDDEGFLDTVGAICVDDDGNIAAALSSGGIAYKVPGRVGLAGCPRMGCNASNYKHEDYSAIISEDTQETNSTVNMKRRRHNAHVNRQKCRKNGFAVACSGRGEHFIRSGFVATLSRLLGKSLDMEKAVTRTFAEAKDDNGDEAIEGGVLALILNPSDCSSVRKRGKRSKMVNDGISARNKKISVQLGVAFTTPCMGVGFLHSEIACPQAQILRQPRAFSSKWRRESQLSVHVSFLSLQKAHHANP